MTEPPNATGRRRGRGLRPWLIQLKWLGLLGFLGGLASLGAMGLFGPTPDSIEGWMLLRAIMRAVFWPVLFSGLILTIVAGILLWLQRPKAFLRTRWFRLKLGLLCVLLPTLHLWARGGVTEFYLAIDTGGLAELPALRNGVTRSFVVALLVMLVIASIGRFKPRLGERPGSRASRG